MLVSLCCVYCLVPHTPYPNVPRAIHFTVVPPNPHQKVIRFSGVQQITKSTPVSEQHQHEQQITYLNEQVKHTNTSICWDSSQGSTRGRGDETTIRSICSMHSYVDFLWNGRPRPQGTRPGLKSWTFRMPKSNDT